MYIYVGIILAHLSEFGDLIQILETLPMRDVN